MKRRHTRSFIGSLAARCRSTWLLAGVAFVMHDSAAYAQCDPDIPYAGNFSGASIPGCYTVIDDNADGYTWQGATQAGFTNQNVANYNGQGGAGGELAPDDWLITPGLNTAATTTYRLTFKYRVNFGNFAPIGLKVHAGSSATVPGMAQLLQDLGLVGNTTAQEIEIDFTPGEGPIHIGFHAIGHSAGWNMGMQVGDITVVALSGCDLEAPSGLEATGTNTTGTTLQWNAVSGADDHEYEVRTSGAPGSGATGLTTSGISAGTSAVISGLLTPNTSYTAYVRARCATEDPSDTWSTGATFSTPCENVALPFEEDFTAAGSFGCFTSQNLLPSPDPMNHPYWNRFTTNWSSYGFTGPTAAIFHGTGFAPNAWMFLPPVELEGGTEYKLSYLFGKAGNVVASRFAALEVWYGTIADGNDMVVNGVELVDHGAFNHDAQPNALTFTPASTDTYYIGFRCNGSFYSATYTVVDELVLEVAPECAQPTDVIATPSGSGLEVSWDCAGCTGDFLVEYGLSSNFNTPGAGASAGSNGTVASTDASSPLFINELIPGETYRVFVRQLCGVEYGDNSLAATGTTGLPNTACFDAIDLDCDDDVSANTDPAPLQVTGLCDPSTANTYGVWYAVTGDGGDFTLSTCPAENGSASFNTRISVLTSDDCSTFSCVANSAQPTGCGSVTWTTIPDEYYFVYVSGHAGSGERGSFTMTLSCTPPPSCFPPSNLTATGISATNATLNWSNSGFNIGTVHEYELRTSGAPGSGPAGLAASGSADNGTVGFGALNGNTNYTFSVRADCGDGDLSGWVTTSFSTPCSVTNIPYNASFSSGSIPSCFTVVNANDDAFTWVGAVLAGFTNSNVAVYNNFDGNEAVPNDWLITQSLNTTAGITYRVSLKHRLNFAFAAGAVGLQVYAGTSADPNDMVLLEDLGDVTTAVITPRTVDFTATGGPLYIGFKAGVNSSNSTWSFALYLGDITVDALDCEGTLNGSAVPGSPCDDGDSETENDTWTSSCTCIGTPVIVPGTDMVLELRTPDGSSDQISWEIVDLSDAVVCGGGPYSPGITAPIVESCSLPNGCYRLRVFDSAGDGFGTGGGYQLRLAGGDPFDLRIIDNLDNFTSGTESSIGSGPNTFCFPMSTQKPIFVSRDKLDWVNNQYLVAEPDAAVSAEWIPGAPNNLQSATTGYQFWFFDPNGTYSFRRGRAHNTSDNFGPANEFRACHMRINNWAVANQIPDGVLMNVRIRTRVNGVYGNFGPAYRFKIDAQRALCPLTKLNDIPDQPALSCNSVRNWGPGNFVHARQVSGANRYQFRFRIPAENFVVAITSNTYFLQLNWGTNPLEEGKTYLVDVRASKDNGATWCSNFIAPNLNPWGEVCNLTIGSGAQDDEQNLGLENSSNGTLAMWPNPNRGDQLWIDLNGIEAGVASVAVDIFDMTGKQIVTRIIPTSFDSAQDVGRLNTVLDLQGDLATGMYLVNITAGEKRYTERLVIAR